jgi:NitT/TauT family transport system permease protein
MKTALRRILFILLLIGIWELLYRMQIWPPMLFPSPEQVFNTLFNGFRDRSLIFAIGISMKRIIIGYCLSLMIGVVIGICMGSYKWIEDTLGSVVLGLQNLPSICWLPLAILWWGYSEKAIIFVTFMGAVLSIAMATDAGIKNVPPIFIKAGRNMGARGWTLFRYVILPAASPTVFSGMKQGWAFAWRSLMAAELIFATMGLGFVLQMGRELLDTSQVIAVMVLIVIIGSIIDRLFFTRMENKLRTRWGLI